MGAPGLLVPASAPKKKVTSQRASLKRKDQKNGLKKAGIEERAMTRQTASPRIPLLGGPQESQKTGESNIAIGGSAACTGARRC